MNLQEALNLTAPKRPQCSIGKALADLTDDQRAAVTDALADDTVETAHLARALSLMAGSPIASQNLGRHRNGGCRCGA